MNPSANPGSSGRTLPSTFPKPFVLQGAPRAELARLCRHICLAREKGAMSPVTAEDEFLLALATARATYGPASINEDDLKEIVATEESRVADASVIAELIASRLAAQQPTAPAAAPHPATARTPSAPPFSTGNSSSPLSIADLIDGMLSQEKRDVRQPANA